MEYRPSNCNRKLPVGLCYSLQFLTTDPSNLCIMSKENLNALDEITDSPPKLRFYLEVFFKKRYWGH